MVAVVIVVRSFLSHFGVGLSRKDLVKPGNRMVPTVFRYLEILLEG